MSARRILLILALAACSWTVSDVSPPPAFGQSGDCQAQGEVHVCRVKGLGAILNQDVAQAKDEALIDARRKAIEQVAGVRIDADTITRNQVLFDQIVRSQSAGVIQAERVLDARNLGDGSYQVQIEAWVKPAEVQDRVAANVSELSMIVAVPEKNIGAPQTFGVIETAIVSKLLEGDYRVLDHAQVERVSARDRMAALLRGDAQTAREIGLKFLSNLVVVGEATTRFSQNNSGIVSAYARVAVRVIESDTGRIVANLAEDRIRGFGRDEIGAGEDALNRGAKPFADKLREALDDYFKKKDRPIEIRLRGLPTIDEFRRARAFLEKQRWVNGVSDKGYSPTESVIVLTYPEKTLYLASRIAREPKFRLVEYDRSRILIGYQP